MTYDYKLKKIVAVISGNLEGWQAMNVLGHMAIALGANKDPDLMGRPILRDRSNEAHTGIARFGFIVKKGTSANIFSLVSSARKERGLIMVDFPREMLDTRHDDELADAVSNKQEADFEYLGVLLYGESEQINALTKKFELWS